MATISIIVPVYNAEKQIKKCIESLISQTYYDIEIILVDDGSKDSSLAICDDFAVLDNRVRVFHKANGGVSSARNYGLAEAKAKYIQFVDSDDHLEPDACKKLLEEIEYAKTELVVCGYFKHTPNETRSIIYKGKTYDEFVDLERDFINLYPKLFFNYIWNKLYIREKITFRFDEEVSYGEDFIFNMNYLKNINRISVIEAPLYHYYFMDNSLATSYNSKKIIDSDRMYNYSVDFAMKLSRELSLIEIINKQHFNRGLILMKQIVNSSNLSENQKQSEIKKIIETDSFRKSLRHNNKSIKNLIIAKLIALRLYRMLYFLFKIKRYADRKLL